MRITIIKKGIHGKGITIDNNYKDVLIYADKDVLVRDADYVVAEEDIKDVVELIVPWSEYPIIFKNNRG